MHTLTTAHHGKKQKATVNLAEAILPQSLLLMKMIRFLVTCYLVDTKVAISDIQIISTRAHGIG